MNASGIVLCGGRGSRADGADKGLLQWDGKPLAETVLERLAPQVEDVFISANRNLDRYAAFGYPVVSDCLENFQGPLAGIATTLPRCNNPVAVIIPCDAPLLPDDLVERLLKPLRDDSVDLSYVNDGGRDHYLHAAIRRRCLGTLLDYLDSGERSVRGWHQKLNCVSVDFSDCSGAFANLNRGDRE